MADGEFFWANPHLPTHLRDAAAVETIFAAAQAEDEEDTLLLQLTLPELGMFAYGLTFIERLYPELRPVLAKLGRKLEEVTRAQEYFGSRDEDDEDDDG